MRSIFSRITLAAALALALAFTFSCSSSDDGGGSTAACRGIVNGSSCSEEGCKERSVDTCEEFSGEDVSKHRQEIKEECEKYGGGKFYASCPSGYKLKCNREESSETYYIYDSTIKNCDEYFNWGRE